MSLFSYDSPIAYAISKATDYVLINIMWLVCSIPVITIGASFTARNYAAMKLARGEEESVFKTFFRSFKQNFKQSTIVWLLELVVIAFFYIDWKLMLATELTQTNLIFRIALFVATLFVAASCISVFAFIARFEMTIREYIKASFVLSFIKFPRMVLALILMAAPVILSYAYFKWLPAVLVVIPALELYYNSRMYVKVFSRLEPEKAPITPDEEFHIELEETSEESSGE